MTKLIEVFSTKNTDAPLIGFDCFTMKEMVFTVEGIKEIYLTIPQYNILHICIDFFGRSVYINIRLNKTGQMRAK